MCGICGVVGEAHTNSIPHVLKGLENLLYRGYDSVGIATIDNGEIKVRKGVGKLNEVNQRYKLSEMVGSVAIGHDRWATHGNVTDQNAHPHLSCDRSVAVVHNGTIENHTELRKKLENNGHKFRSQTDTEIVPHLIERNYSRGDSLERSTYKALSYLKGDWALAIIGNRDPNKIVVAMNERPIIIGLGNEGGFVASDTEAFNGRVDKAIHLNDYEMGVVTPKSLTVYDKNLKEIKRRETSIPKYALPVLRNGYATHMESEIVHQPHTLLDTINGLKEPELAKRMTKAANLLVDSDDIVGVGCGTSYNALLYNKILNSKLLGKRVDIEIGSESAELSLTDKRSVVIAVSQSGETADVIYPIKQAKKNGAKIIGITNKPKSQLDRLADITLYMNSGPEIGVAATKTFTSTLGTFVELTKKMAEEGGSQKSHGRSKIRELSESLRQIPNKMSKVIKQYDNEINEIADTLYKQNAVYFIGRRENVVSAMEGALKLKEIAYIHSEAHRAGELKHGPLALIEKGTVVFASIPHKDSCIYHKTLNNIQEVKARGAYVIGLVDSSDRRDHKNYIDYRISIPSTSPYLRPFLDTPFYQKVALRTAQNKGLNPDMPRNLAKSVTVQ